MLIKRFPAITAESILFYSCLIVTIGILVFCGSFPTLDGPSHIYNADVTNYILSGNKFISQFYSISRTPSPNFTDHYLLVVIRHIFSFENAGKVLQIVYVVSFTVLFRSLVFAYNPAGIGLTIFSIPFAFNFLYYLGFYNFCLSFPLLFIIVLYYHKNFYAGSSTPVLKKYLILELLILLLYFTNGLAFLFSGMLLGLVELRNILWLNRSKTVTPRSIVLKRIIPFVLIWLPGLIMFLVFMSHSRPSIAGEEHTFVELLGWLSQARALIVYTGLESEYIRWITIALFISIVTGLFYRIKNKVPFWYPDSVVFLMAFFILLLMFFIIPDGSSVGMMSIRFCIYVFVFFLLWLSMQNNYKAITWIVSVIVIAAHFTLLVNDHLPAEQGLEERSEIMKATADYIQPNSIVLDIDVTDNWLYGHFGDYLTSNKPLVIIPNYEPNYGWFATVWNDEVPQIIYNGNESVPKYCDLPNGKNKQNTQEIQYVFIHGDFNKIQKEDKWSGVKEGLINRYVKAYTSADSSIHLFQLKGMSTALLPN
jgi:hypothetical protein